MEHAFTVSKKYEKEGSLIVKVQVPIATNEPTAMAMVYNKSRDFQVFMEITPELMKAMDGRFKAFFKAHYDQQNNNTILEAEAPQQNW